MSGFCDNMEKENKKPIIVRLNGGLGNQMFQYALGRKLSLKYHAPLFLDLTFLNHRIKMPEFLRPNFTFRNFTLDVFNIKASIARSPQIAFWNRPIFRGKTMLILDAILRKLAIFPGWEKSFSFDPKVLLLGPGSYLEGFWHSERYFKDIEETLRKDFTLRNPLTGKTKELYVEIRDCASLCIHVRRTDVAENSFYHSIPLEYYHSGLEYIKQYRQIEKVYVFSDDLDWCRKNLKFRYPTVYVGPEHAGKHGEGHLHLMSAGRNFIIANSTFSWWAAWLSDNPDKMVIAPKRWFRINRMDDSDLIPEKWIRL